MNFINQINGFLAKSLGFLNAVLAILLVLFATAISIGWVGGLVGLGLGLLVGGGNGRGGLRLACRVAQHPEPVWPSHWPNGVPLMTSATNQKILRT